MLSANVSDKVRAVTIWFDCYFTNSNNRKLSTSPYKKSTHWKQTTFYLPEALDVKEGDKIQLNIAVAKNKQNPRHLMIKLGIRYK